MRSRRSNGAGGLIKQPSGLYLAKWSYQGKTYVRSTQTHNESEARKKLDEFVRPFLEKTQLAVIENLEAKVRTIEKTSEQLDLSKKLLTNVDTIFNQYIESISDPITDSTKETYRTYIKNYLSFIKREYGYVNNIGQIKKSMNQEFLNYLTSKNISSATYNSHLITLRRVFNSIIKNSNLWDFKPKKHVPVYNKRALTNQELVNIFNYIKEDKDILLLFTLGIYTGLRLSDCSLIKWNNINLDNSLISIVPYKLKRFNKQIYIPIHKNLWNLLNEYRNQLGDQINMDSYISNLNAHRYLTNELAPIIKDIFTFCGINNGTNKLGFHTLRHTFVSMCANKGVPLSIVQSIVGHRCVEMTERYFHLNNILAGQVIQKIEF